MIHRDLSENLSRRSFISRCGAAGAALLGAPAILRGAAPLVRGPELGLPPFLTRPTTRSVSLHARNGPDPVRAAMEVWPAGTPDETVEQRAITAGPAEFFHWNVEGLEPNRRYEYRVTMAVDDHRWPMAQGHFVTQRSDSEGYTAALITDAHVGAFPDGSPEVKVTEDVIRNVRRDRPEFVLALGDNVAWSSSRDDPQEEPAGAERAYSMYRRHAGPVTSVAPHFGVVGNWEGESGKFPEESIETAGSVRRRFTPNPDGDTYPEGGSPDEDYYAFTWGPALYVILNVQTYTVPSGPLDRPRDDVYVVEDWTLGPAQLQWLERTLASSSHPFKFVCIHHAVGGHGGDEHNTLYGRGGARAARIGEQRTVHELMREFGVQIFFYGHDHVFVDDVVDGIHYALPGSFGAPWRFPPAVTGYERYWPDAGHARLHVRPTRARVEYVNQAGRVFHSFEVEAR